MCEICSSLIEETQERCQCRYSGASNDNVGQIAQFFPVFLLMALNR